MSVGDMNKRVRALVEWVGREQASASERYRRREALQAALGEATSLDIMSVSGTVGITVDGGSQSHPPVGGEEKSRVGESSSIGGDMKMMEELMEELIGFQERFGPGAKSKERRTAMLS
jgi:hypothetical protein